MDGEALLVIIPIREATGHVEAMGHRVSQGEGGVSELKRRCLETLSRLNTPPDEIRFHRIALTTPPPAPAAPSRPPAPPSRPPAAVVEPAKATAPARKRRTS
jgi:hypothetical protein